MEWKFFGKWYRVSESGEVLSKFSGDWKVMKQKKSKSDNFGGFYMTVSFHKGHKKVHHLVWEQFVGPRRKGYVINHKNGNREDCSLGNLEEITQKENIANVIARGKFKLFGKPYTPATSSSEEPDFPEEPEYLKGLGLMSVAKESA